MKEDLVWLKRRGSAPGAPQLHELSRTACMTMLSKLEPPRGICYFRMQTLNHLKRQLAEAASPPPALGSQQQFGISTPSPVLALAAAAAVAVAPGQEAWQQPASPFVSQSSLRDAASASSGWHATGSTAPPSAASSSISSRAAAASAPEPPLLRNALTSPTPAARPSTSSGNRSQQLFDSSSQAVRPKTASSQPQAPSQRSTQSSQAAAKRPRHSSPSQPVGQVHIHVFHN
jgi:hypothetical protein